MPRFFFHVRMGEPFPDEHGTTLPGRREAHNVALEVLAGLIRDAADELWRGEALSVVAEDEQRMPLFAIDVTTRLGGSEPGSEANVREFHSGRVPL
jgi:hypothetical protein